MTDTTAPAVAETDPWYRGPKPAWVDIALANDFATSRDTFRDRRYADLCHHTPDVVADVEQRIAAGLEAFDLEPSRRNVARTLEYLGSRLADLTMIRWDEALRERVDMSAWDAASGDLKRGAVVLVPHFGPLELLVQAISDRHPVTVVVSHGARFHPDNQTPRSLSDDGNFELLRAPQAGLSLALSRRLARGRLVVFPAEFSSRGDDRFMNLNVLDQAVRVPLFPMRLADARHVPCVWSVIDDTTNGWVADIDITSAPHADWCQQRFNDLSVRIRAAPHKWEGWVASTLMIPT